MGKRAERGRDRQTTANHREVGQRTAVKLCLEGSLQWCAPGLCSLPRPLSSLGRRTTNTKHPAPQKTEAEGHGTQPPGDLRVRVSRWQS